MSEREMMEAKGRVERNHGTHQDRVATPRPLTMIPIAPRIL